MDELKFFRLNFKSLHTIYYVIILLSIFGFVAFLCWKAPMLWTFLALSIIILIYVFSFLYYGLLSVITITENEITFSDPIKKISIARKDVRRIGIIEYIEEESTPRFVDISEKVNSLTGYFLIYITTESKIIDSNKLVDKTYISFQYRREIWEYLTHKNQFGN